ncbi:MAG: OmpA family protein [Pseudomonadota bacterium]
MLSKTIKLGLSLLFAAVFLAGCASTSEPEPAAPASEPTPPPVVTPAPAPTPEPAAPSLATVFYFDFDQSILRAETRQLLNAHAAVLKSSPRAIRLEGHADERGTREYNMALGERRALAVRDYLRSEGVTSAIEVVSYGEERAFNLDSNEFAWQQNRRVELK